MKQAGIASKDGLPGRATRETGEAPHGSPAEPGVSWRGVIVRPPARLVLPDMMEAHARFDIPVRGFYLVNVSDTYRHPGPKVLVFTDLESGEVSRADMFRQEGELLVPQVRTDPVNPALPQTMRNFFNFNVCDYVRLPLRPARYRLQVLFAGYTSNSPEIEVVQREPPAWPRRWRMWAALRYKAWLRPDEA
ncbi:hypothetical protein LE190_07365 [Massilia oculi]|uniref:Uncharacterized protein n=1 Tax=Massilia hydrophila TaxID=3044279 RepID=A0ABS7Y9S6_9BURK|nr:hypothetical protein [Massilia oculi]MCA1855742.1 hypothetical protein [Massilia oculi]